MPLGHVSLPTTPSTHARMRDFYASILQPLGYKVYKEQALLFCGLGTHLGPDFWLHCGGDDSDINMKTVDPSLPADENRKRLSGRTHVAFDVGSRGAVDGWYKNAVKAGGIPNGEPGEREYVKGYYAAFVLDPLGNNVEAVYFSPWWLKTIKAAPGVVAMVFGAVAGHFALGYAKEAGWV